MSAMLKVKFRADRSWKEEEVEALDTETVTVHRWACKALTTSSVWQLKGVWEHVLASGGEGATEHLKPFKMALVSQRCFWSMIQYVCQLMRDSNASDRLCVPTSHYGDVETGFRALFPDRGDCCARCVACTHS